MIQMCCGLANAPAGSGSQAKQACAEEACAEEQGGSGSGGGNAQFVVNGIIAASHNESVVEITLVFKVSETQASVDVRLSDIFTRCLENRHLLSASFRPGHRRPRMLVWFSRKNASRMAAGTGFAAFMAVVDEA